MALEGLMLSEHPEPSVADIERRLEEQVAATARATRVIVIAGMVAAAGLGIYLHVVIGKLHQAIGEPKVLAAAMRHRVELQMPQTMASLENSLRHNAPQIVADTRVALFRKLPIVREKVAKSLADYLVSRISAALEKELRKVIQKIMERRNAAPAPGADAGQPQDSAALAAEFQKLIKETLDEPLRVELARAEQSLVLGWNASPTSPVSRTLGRAGEAENTPLADWTTLFTEALREAAKNPLTPPPTPTPK